jgi:hypothetical protein
LGNYFGAEESGELTAFVGARHAGEQDVALVSLALFINIVVFINFKILVFILLQKNRY